MFGARLRRAVELKERKRKEARVKRFVKKRSKMHWGAYSMDGDQQPCTYTTVKVRVRGVQAAVEITYRYRLAAGAIEYYFPMCEVPGIDQLQVAYKQGANPFEVMAGRLYEQTEDGVTKPWRKESSDEEEDDASETRSLLSSLWGEAKPKRDQGSRALFYYFFGTSPGLQTLQADQDLVVKVTYVAKCPTEKQPYEDNDIVIFALPLTIFSKPPDSWDIQVEMRDFIRRIRPKLHTVQKLFTEIRGKKAVVRPHDAYPIALEDEAFVLNIELGEPIEPRCADPVALFIFATFMGLMIWFSLTKDLH